MAFGVGYMVYQWREPGLLDDGESEEDAPRDYGSTLRSGTLCHLAHPTWPISVDHGACRGQSLHTRHPALVSSALKKPPRRRCEDICIDGPA
jgi:hypothetical protein